MKGRAVTVVVGAAMALALSAASGAARPAAVAATSAGAVAPAPTSVECQLVNHVACYSPRQLQRAYGLRALYAEGLSGQGSTIVVVDPFGSPAIRHDLSTFDRYLHVPAPPHLRIIRPAGPVPPFDPNNAGMLDKAGETTLDVEWSHAIAPRANILLVETPVMENGTGKGFAQLMTAERFVIDHRLGDVITQSFGLPEENFKPGRVRSLRRTFIDARRHRVTVLAATNDLGVTGPTPAGGLYRHRVVDWPADDPLVTAVGGTRLHLGAAGQRTSPDTVWNDNHDAAVDALTGQGLLFPWAGTGGLSHVFARPVWQRSVRSIVGDHRGVPDVSMSAAFSGGVIGYESYPGGPAGWGTMGGTSEASPEFAGIVALADQYAHTRLHHARLGLINPALYKLQAQHAPGIVDVRRGTNTVSFITLSARVVTLRGYRARRGYDLTSGIGTINAARFVPELARAASGEGRPAALRAQRGAR